MAIPDTPSPSLAPANGAAAPPALAPALPPLALSGVVVAKADLVAALRLWVPGLTDLAPLGDDQFLLRLGGEAAEGSAR